MREITDKDSKKQNNNFIETIKKHKKKILILIFLCILIYIIYVFVKFIQNPTDTVYVEMGQIQEEETVEGYIIRDETVLKGKNYKNGIEQIKTEGEKVAKGEAIFRYYSSGEKELVEKIKELDSKIGEAMNNEKNLLLPDIKVLEEQIDTKISQLYGESDLRVIENNKQAINNNMKKKAKIVGEQSPAGSYLKKLIDERSEYENKLNSGTEYLSATKSGVVSYKVDGYEDIFTTTDFSKYTKTFLNDLKIKSGQMIPTNNESGKIIDNYHCYIVCILDSEYAKEAEIGDVVKLHLPSGSITEATIEYKTVEDNEVIVTFKIDEKVEELIEYRKISLSVIWWSETGLKVPNTAIKTEEKDGNNITYVTRTRIGYEDNILVKVLKSNEKYSIVANYSSEELLEKGYTSKEIWSLPNITIYDEILIH